MHTVIIRQTENYHLSGFCTFWIALTKGLHCCLREVMLSLQSMTSRAKDLRTFFIGGRCCASKKKNQNKPSQNISQPNSGSTTGTLTLPMGDLNLPHDHRPIKSQWAMWASLTTCLRFFSIGVSSSTISSIPASLRNTSLRSSSRFGVWGFKREAKECVNYITASSVEYQTEGLWQRLDVTTCKFIDCKYLTSDRKGPYFSMAFLNGVGVRGVVSRSDLWFGVTNLQGQKRKPSGNFSKQGLIQMWWFENAQRVFLLSKWGFITVKRCCDDGFLTAHRSGCKWRIFQIQSILLGPHIKELWKQIII